MGAITAAYGLKRCMNILHGSQGCSTYIRRHMATHYNEPIDIASSSLTEHGAVYGGEENLCKGLDNLIRLYEPQIITVTTTCLAETIGEDVPQILARWRANHPEHDAHLIPVASPGYGGTQFEGWWRTLHTVVVSVEMDATPHNAVNVVCGPLSPADMRWLIDVFDRLGLEAIFLPDVSENLDRGFEPHYDRLPQQGTSLEDIRRMAGARITLELSTFVCDEDSVALYLHKHHNVPYHRMALPLGLRATSDLLDKLTTLLGKDIGSAPEQGKEPSLADKTVASLARERARYLDAMVDSHKYAAAVRAVIYGEPDFVYAATRMCVEVGIFPVVVATGSRCEQLSNLLTPEIEPVASAHIADFYAPVQPEPVVPTPVPAPDDAQPPLLELPQSFPGAFCVRDNADFNTIEQLAQATNANVLLGSGDGRRVAHKLGLPLVRCTFPIHDHIGGQRTRTLGYEGSLRLIDAMVNAIIEHKEATFRDDLKERYY